MDLTFHDSLVEHAKFPSPETSTDDTTAFTDICEVDVGLLNNKWKALHAVRDNDLANKLCNALRTTFSETLLTGPSTHTLLQHFLPTLLVGEGGLVCQLWSKNPCETHLSVKLAPCEFALSLQVLGQSKWLLARGVFNAMERCLWDYDQSNLDTSAEQRVQGAMSAVDSHVLVNGELVALVEAESLNVMNKLGELLAQNTFEMRWTSGSTSLVSSKRLVYAFPSANTDKGQAPACQGPFTHEHAQGVSKQAVLMVRSSYAPFFLNGPFDDLKSISIDFDIFPTIS